VSIVPRKSLARTGGVGHSGEVTNALTLRPAAPSDAPALLNLIVATNLAERGEPDCTLQDVLDEWARPSYRAWLFEDGDGAVTGAITVAKMAGEAAIEASVIAYPGRGDTLIPSLLEAALATARELDPASPVHIFTDSSRVPLRSALEAAGGQVVRVFLRMLGDISAASAPVDLPDGVQIRAVRQDSPEDLRAMYDVLNTAFLDHFGNEAASFEDWVDMRSSVGIADRSLWWLAFVDAAPAAGLIGRLNPTRGWVQEIGTLSAYRGRGLGRMLLLSAFAEFRARGFNQAGLGVDSTNPTGAVGLYESVGLRRTNEWTCYEFTP
jgi:mycothiol synthase